MASVPRRLLQAVLAFVFDGRAGRLLGHLGIETATLDHEAGNHAVKDRAVIETAFGVLQEIRNTLRRLVAGEFDGDLAERSGDFDGRCGPGGKRNKQAGGEQGDFL